MSSAHFGKGLKPTSPAKIAHMLGAHEHPGIAAKLRALAGHADMTALEPPRLDQGPTSACTAHSFAGACVTAFAASGAPIPYVPSPRELYAATRAIERELTAPSGATLPELVDGGAELADVLTAAARYGVAPMRWPTPDGRYSDVWPEVVDGEPRVLELERASMRLVGGAYRIDPHAADAVEQVAAALEANLPVWLGFFCDSAFENLPVGAVAGAPDESDKAGGGHAVYLSGYSTPEGGGGRVFTLTNSWGPSWCNAGRCLVSEAWVRACWDLFPMAVARASVVSTRPSELYGPIAVGGF